jgi:serine/threonine-protein kinase HipA
MRHKCTVLDEDGTLALGKFPSVNDERSVTRVEVLALRLARLAGIDAAHARIVMVQGVPVAILRRFDRMPNHVRIP